MDKVLVSACLLGQPVRYNGKGLLLESAVLQKWQADGIVVSLCPEVSAGFPTPRPPAEIETGHGGEDVLLNRARILEDNGNNVTTGFVAGATIAVETAKRHGCNFALLTDGSPSCGSTFIYSGNHDGIKRPGTGVVAAALRQAGVKVFAEHEIKILQAHLEKSMSIGPVC